MPTHSHGRHEHGQNFLVDARTIRDVVALAADAEGPILEIGPGDGALTGELLRLGRPLTAVEIDERLVARLRRRFGRRLGLVHDDFLRTRIPFGTGTVIGNLPFHLTTAILRKLLHDPNWGTAVLLLQWEVARRRAGVGGATLMTAQWSPWFEFSLHGRVPARAFRPMPGVDGGVLRIRRRDAPLVPASERAGYQAFAHRVYTGPGRGLAAVLRRAAPEARAGVDRWLRESRIGPNALPRDLDAEQWAALWAIVRPSGRRRGRTGARR